MVWYFVKGLIATGFMVACAAAAVTGSIPVWLLIAMAVYFFVTAVASLLVANYASY